MNILTTRDGVRIEITSRSGTILINQERVWSLHRFSDVHGTWIQLNTPKGVYVVALADYLYALQLRQVNE